MKKPMIAFAAACALLTSFAQEAVRPRVAPAFGTIIKIEARFVAKAQTYHAQNIVKEPFALEVTTVNGKALPKPIQIEYQLEETDKAKTATEKPGAVQSFEAYETLYQPAMANPFLKPTDQQMPFVLISRLHLRRPTGHTGIRQG